MTSKITNIYRDGKILKLTPNQRRVMKSKQLTIGLVQDRVSEGWSIKLATSLEPKYVMKYGEIYWTYALPEETLYIPLEVKRKINFEHFQVRRNMQKGKTLEEIINGQFDYFIESNDKTEYDLALEDVKREKRAKKIKEEILRYKKPHLYNGTPQSVAASDWYLYLCENDIYKKRG